MTLYTLNILLQGGRFKGLAFKVFDKYGQIWINLKNPG